MTLRPYQKEIIENIFKELTCINSVLIQSATGSGKTVIMCAFIQKWLSLNQHKKVLVSVHRQELVEQTSLTLAKFGILNQQITAKSKPDFNQNVFVGMTQTIYARKINIDIDLLIVDEAHEQIHVKTFDFFKNAKRVGFTATPIINKRISYFECDVCNKQSQIREICCFGDHMAKWSKPVTMSETYENIIVGVPIKELIDEGSLIDELVYCYDFYSNLEAGENDDFDENDIAKESVKHDQNVLDEYIDKALGKKTMIFTASTKQNLSLVETFKDYPIKSYDSVNNENTERQDIVKWFRNTNGAILVSTGTFTTGFDVKEVECIIVNRPTTSLSLWLQIIGRGARPSDLIFKDNFIVIDLGGNVARLGQWSDDINWLHIFFKGLKPKKRKKEVLVQCEKCEYNFIGCEGEPCPDCGHSNINHLNKILNPHGSKDPEVEKVDKMTKRVSVVPIPNGRKIAEFVKRTTNNKNDYYKILIDKYIDLWKLNNVEEEIYQKRVTSGMLEFKIMEYLKKNYGFVNKLEHGQPRTYEYLLEKIKTKLEACYIKKTLNY
jgi:superfamily II DNA or RNA helicase